MLKPGSLGAAASRAPASQPQLGCLRGLPPAFLTDCAFATSRLAEGTLSLLALGPLAGLSCWAHSGRKAGPRLAVQLPRRALGGGFVPPRGASSLRVCPYRWLWGLAPHSTE